MNQRFYPVAIHVAADHGLQPQGMVSQVISEVLASLEPNLLNYGGNRKSGVDRGKELGGLRSMLRRIMVCNRNGYLLHSFQGEPVAGLPTVNKINGLRLIQFYIEYLTGFSVINPFFSLI